MLSHASLMIDFSYFGSSSKNWVFENALVSNLLKQGILVLMWSWNLLMKLKISMTCTRANPVVFVRCKMRLVTLLVFDLVVC